MSQDNSSARTIVVEFNELVPGRVPYDYRVLLPGYSDKLAYDLGLLKTDTSRVQANREELAIRFALQHGVILLLKGRQTIITDGRRIAVNS